MVVVKMLIYCHPMSATRVDEMDRLYENMKEGFTRILAERNGTGKKICERMRDPVNLGIDFLRQLRDVREELQSMSIHDIPRAVEMHFFPDRRVYMPTNKHTANPVAENDNQFGVGFNIADLYQLVRARWEGRYRQPVDDVLSNVHDAMSRRQRDLDDQTDVISEIIRDRDTTISDWRGP
jgi:hypothetical protein